MTRRLARFVWLSCLLLGMTPTAFGQDPETVATVANVLLKYFNQQGEDARWQAMENRLGAIERELRVIELQLKEISEQLVKLQATVEEQPDIEARDRVLADVNLVADRFRDWIAARRKGRMPPDLGDVLTRLQTDVNNLMLHSSWSCYEVVALGMLTERDLLALTRAERQTRFNRFDRYRRYFADAQNISVAASIGKRWKYYHDLAIAHKAQLSPPVDATCYIGKDWLSNDRDKICKYHIHQVVIGSIRDGFCYGETQRRNEHACYSKPRPIDEKPGKPFAMMLLGGNERQGRTANDDPTPAPYDTSGFLGGDVANPQPLPGCRSPVNVSEYAPPGAPIDGVPNTWCPEVLNPIRKQFVDEAGNSDYLSIALQAANRFEREAQKLRDQFKPS